MSLMGSQEGGGFEDRWPGKGKYQHSLGNGKGPWGGLGGWKPLKCCTVGDF